MEIKGLKVAVGDFNRANSGGKYSSTYGYLMFDKSTGKLWTDEFVSAGHNAWKSYDSDSIVNLGLLMEERNIDVNMHNVKDFITNSFEGF